MKRGIMTIAMGQEFADYAKLLARCLRYHGETYPLAVLTDVAAPYYEGLFDRVVPVAENDPFREDPFFLKLQLPAYSPFSETLFLDADTVVFDRLTVVWNHIEYCNQPFFSYGYLADRGLQYEAPAEQLLQVFGSEYINCHNGGLYYFDDSARAAAVFAHARQAIPRFDALFPHTNQRTDHVSDELLLAYGMSKFDLKTFATEVLGPKCAYAPLLPVTESLAHDFRRKSCRVKYTFSDTWYEPVVLHYSANNIITKQELYRQVAPLLTGGVPQR